jgi:hypothetical protein
MPVPFSTLMSVGDFGGLYPFQASGSRHCSRTKFGVSSRTLEKFRCFMYITSIHTEDDWARTRSQIKAGETNAWDEAIATFERRMSEQLLPGVSIGLKGMRGRNEC